MRFAPAPDPPPGPVRIRCRGGWHEATVADGRLQLPHAPDELRREELLHALGAPLAGCASVRSGWSSGHRLPRGLRDLREHLFLRAFHGDAPGVLALLDAGFGPAVATDGGPTLMHYLAFLDHRELLPRLLAAGLDVNRPDGTHRTPLDRAVTHGADALIADLAQVGARRTQQ